MGGKYGSIFVKSKDMATVLKVLEKLAKKRRRFLVAPPRDGWIAIYPETTFDDETPKKLAQVSDCGIIHAWDYDDDIFGYSYYQDGKLIDEYNSRPDYFEAVSDAKKAGLRGQPQSFNKLLTSSQIKRLESLLAREDHPVFASELLQEFSEILELPNALTSYEYLMDGETEEIDAWDEFIHVPDLSAEKVERKRFDQHVESEKQQLRERGLLLLEQGETTGAWPMCISHDREGAGFLVYFALFESGAANEIATLKWFKPPWSLGPSQVDSPFNKPNTRRHASPSGRYVAVVESRSGEGQVVGICDYDDGTCILQVPHSNFVISASFTPAEEFCATLGNGGELIVSSIKERAVKAAYTVPVSKVALSPVGSIALLNVQSKLVVFDWASGMFTKTLYLGGKGFADQSCERPAAVEFSPDGRWLFCATDLGIRVFDWHSVMSMPGDVPAPVYAGSIELPGPEKQALLERNLPAIDKSICALAYDPKRSRVLYAGVAGTIGFLDLTDGRSGVLLEVPGRPLIISMMLSGDGKSLCCICRPEFLQSGGRKEKPPVVQIWNYATLPL